MDDRQELELEAAQLELDKRQLCIDRRELEIKQRLRRLGQPLHINTVSVDLTLDDHHEVQVKTEPEDDNVVATPWLCAPQPPSRPSELVQQHGDVEVASGKAEHQEAADKEVQKPRQAQIANAAEYDFWDSISKHIREHGLGGEDLDGGFGHQPPGDDFADGNSNYGEPVFVAVEPEIPLVKQRDEEQLDVELSSVREQTDGESSSKTTQRPQPKKASKRRFTKRGPVFQSKHDLSKAYGEFVLEHIEKVHGRSAEFERFKTEVRSILDNWKYVDVEGMLSRVRDVVDPLVPDKGPLRRNVMTSLDKFSRLSQTWWPICLKLPDQDKRKAFVRRMTRKLAADGLYKGSFVKYCRALKKDVLIGGRSRVELP